MIGAGLPKTGRPKKLSEREGRDRQLCIRISNRDLRKLNDICSHMAVTKTDFLTMCIQETWAKM